MTENEYGQLVIGGRLGEAVASGSTREFTRAIREGTDTNVDNPLTYQDIQDYQDFRTKYLLVGIVDSKVLIIRADGATFAGAVGGEAVFSPAEVSVTILED